MTSLIIGRLFMWTAIARCAVMAVLLTRAARARVATYLSDA